ncbi:PadR family transcriptional regulator [Paludibacterium yongneupense]|uniref:PadR family transcriptional regulator n=1 Tax=Paludibacterium yongneupense TaxID=400061 RepID=UPI0004092567|nr:PadR family transcriptional regulator [Paludibacterium yongneupense]
MKTQLRKGALEMCVLALLEGGDSYVYALVGRLARCMDISEGTVYPLMRRLQADALVATYLLESTSGPARRYYALTGAGRLALVQMKREWIEFVDEINRALRPDDAVEREGDAI